MKNLLYLLPFILMAFTPMENSDIDYDIILNEDFENQCCTKTREVRDSDGQLISSASVTACLDDDLYHGDSNRAYNGACALANFAAGRAVASISFSR